MKLLVALLLSFILFPFSQISAQYFYKEFNILIFDSDQTYDNGHVFTGFRTDATSDSSYISLFRTDVFGNIVWAKRYDNPGNQYGYLVRETQDSGFIVVGVTKGFGLPELDLFVMKTNKDGDFRWLKTFGEPIVELPHELIETIDGGYAIAARTYPQASNGEEVVVKLDSSGTIQWITAFNATESAVRCFEQLNDGSFVYVVCTPLSNSLYKISTTGNIIFCKSLDANDYYIYGLRKTNDGGFITLGSGCSGMQFSKFNSNADFEWGKRLRINSGSGGGSFYDLQTTSDSGFIIAGICYTGGNDYTVICKTNSFGDTTWMRFYSDTSHNNTIHHIRETPSGFSFEFGSQVIQTDANGNSGCPVYHVPVHVDSCVVQVSMLSPQLSAFNNSNNSFSINTTIDNISGTTFCTWTHISSPVLSSFILGPNPFHESLKIMGLPNEISKVTIHNLFGQVLYENIFTSSNEELQLSHLTSGVYLLSVEGKEGIVNRKVVKQ